MQIARLSALLVGSTLAFVGAAQASLIFDNGTNLLAGTGDDPNPVNVNIPMSFSFYGSTADYLRVGMNGGISVHNGVPASPRVEGTSYGPSSLAASSVTYPVIAALWDDLNTQQQSRTGTSAIGATTYANSFSVTFPQAYSYGNSGVSFGYQISLFGGASPTVVSLLNGDQFTFQPGDIALSYSNSQNMTAVDGGSALVGLSNGLGTSSTVVPMPGATVNGVVTSAQINNDILPAGQSFILFRPNGSGSYNASIGTFAPVPEPSTLALLGLAGLVTRRRR